MARRAKRRGCLASLFLWTVVPAAIFEMGRRVAKTLSDYFALMIDAVKQNSIVFWIAAAAAVVFVAARFILLALIKNRNRTALYTLEQVDALDGIQFERFCAALLEDAGYTNVRVTQASGDQGVDIIAEKSGERYAIQCKRYSANVGNFAVQEVYAGAQYYGCSMAAVITNSYYTKSAIELAESTGVVLYDRDSIIRYITSNGAKPSTHEASHRQTENQQKPKINYVDEVKAIRKIITPKKSGAEYVELGKEAEDVFDGNGAAIYYERAIELGYDLPYPYNRLIAMYTVRKQPEDIRRVQELAEKNLIRQTDKDDIAKSVRI